ncbi:PREDICTED: ankyrin repeat domain-containing protein 40-like [Nipponia nippon]|nr:PREDICTED: ankyrin repeat domain-containing protein 40-like [Nipponia nippon]
METPNTRHSDLMECVSNAPERRGLGIRGARAGGARGNPTCRSQPMAFEPGPSPRWPHGPKAGARWQLHTPRRRKSQFDVPLLGNLESQLSPSSREPSPLKPPRRARAVCWAGPAWKETFGGNASVSVFSPCLGPCLTPAVGVGSLAGRTCLHWACKRNQAQVVSCLLDAGADKQILTTKGELAAQLTSKPDIRKILGEEETECQGAKDLNLPIVANYLAHPPFPYVYAEESIPDGLAESQNESASISSASRCETSPSSSATQVESLRTPTSCTSEDDFPALAAPPQLPAPAAAVAAPQCVEPEAETGPACQPPLPRSRGLCSPAASHRAVPLQTDGSPTGPAPTFQPFFFTGTFPYNMQELVLKVRVQNLRDNDFIEIELDRQELTYRDLLRVSCCELGVNPDQVEKIRKLPNTLVRKDKDVARLQDFQELELVLVKTDSSPFRNAASPLTERPCYNSRASKLTY